MSSTKPGWHITSPPSGRPSRNCRIRTPKSGCRGKIIGAGKGGIEGDVGLRGALAKLRTQDVEHQRLGRAEPLRQRLTASALADPGAGRRLLHRLQKRVAHLREQLRVLVAVDEIRRAGRTTPGTPPAAPSVRRGSSPDRAAATGPIAAAAETAGTCRHRSAENASSAGGTAPSASRAGRSRSAGSRPRHPAAPLTSSRPIAGPTTITDVALRRPRPIRSRMARLTPSAIP